MTPADRGRRAICQKGGAVQAGRVFLVEDEANIAEAMQFLLTRDGHSVQVISDGALAMAAIVQGRPDVVILDLMLPGASGLSVLQSLRHHLDPELSQTPVLMLTAKGQGRDRDAALAAGVSAFMTKPFSNAELRDQVRALMAGAVAGGTREGGAQEGEAG